MRHLRAVGVVLCVALGLGGPGFASTLTQYTSFWALGDSLTDDGNLFRETGGATPPAPYFEGRFSNGPVWSEPVAADFEDKGLATGNFAFGGATVGPNAAVPNLEAQIGAFAAASQGRLGARPVASLWFGANDLIALGIPTNSAREVGRAAANGVAAGARALGRLGVRDVVLFNLPRLDKIPRYALIDRAEARRGAKAFNATLSRRADGLRKSGIAVTEIDIASLFNDLLDDPAKFGVIDATTPCFVPGVTYCGDAVAPSLAFFDPIHPSSTIHAAITDVVRAEVAPVPLPAPVYLLVVAVAALALARRRAQGSRTA